MNNATRSVTFPEALAHASKRVQLAHAERVGAQREVALLRAQLDEACALMDRCTLAVQAAEAQLCKLAESGRVAAYCPIHDVFYTYEPGPDVKTERWTGAPPCPRCSYPADDIGVIGAH